MKQVLRTVDPVKTAQRLFYLNAAIWLVIGVASLIRYSDDKGDDGTVTMLVIAVMMFGNVAALLVSGWGLGTLRKWLFAFALGVVTVNITLTITDEFGILDLTTLAINLALFGILLADRKRYL